MKPKYEIGFFLCLLPAAVLLTAGYQLSYRHVMDRQEARAEEEASTTESIAAEGEAVQEDGFYLSELHGYVVVYLSDKTTIYELTEIPLTDLPEEVRQEISAGKYVGTAAELYAFLENYSS